MNDQFMNYDHVNRIILKIHPMKAPSSISAIEAEFKTYISSASFDYKLQKNPIGDLSQIE